MDRGHSDGDNVWLRDITGETPLHRQLVSGWVINGRITSQGFRPTKKDNDILSLAHGDLVTPSEAQRLHRQRGHQSDAVATVNGSDCWDVDLIPVHDAEPAEEHVSLQFPVDASNSQKSNIARRLAAKAILTVPPS